MNEFFTFGHGVERKGVKVDMKLLLAGLHLEGRKNLNADQFKTQIHALADKHDSHWSHKISVEFKEEALRNMEGAIRYY